ncbi:MAG: dephospho-CoA kinase [Sedimentisphaerales bacterium]
MGKSKRKPIIGILGGVGSGKSTVAAEFAKLGCAVIDADKIAHELLDKSAVKKKVVSFFGDAVLERGGKISHKKLADIVFADGDKPVSPSVRRGRLAALERIIHPLVLKRVGELMKQANRRRQVKAIVLDMPLLAEVGWAKRCDKLIFVRCKQQIRAKRAKKMGILELKELKNRENFQISLDKKESIADNTIDNNSGFSALAGQVTDIFSCIMGK